MALLKDEHHSTVRCHHHPPATRGRCKRGAASPLAPHVPIAAQGASLEFSARAPASPPPHDGGGPRGPRVRNGALASCRFRTPPLRRHDQRRKRMGQCEGHDCPGPYGESVRRQSPFHGARFRQTANPPWQPWEAPPARINYERVKLGIKLGVKKGMTITFLNHRTLTSDSSWTQRTDFFFTFFSAPTSGGSGEGTRALSLAALSLIVSDAPCPWEEDP